jgi:outer membrane protein assembly factor BamB
MACACVVAGLAGCSSGASAPSQLACSLPPWHAHALDETVAGWVRWQVQLAAPRGIQEPSPLAVGPVAVFAEDDVLYGLRLADGHRVWSRATGQDIARMWRWGGLVIVLTWPGRNEVPPALLTGLDASTGQALWAQRIDGRLASYDDQTGQLQWADTLEPAPQYAAGLAEQGLQVAAGLAYLTGVQGGEQVLGIGVADGRVKWQFGPRAGVTLTAYSPGLVSVLSNTGGQWQDKLDPVTGRVRWQVATPFRATATAAGVVFGPTGDGVAQVSLRDTLTGQVRWTADSSTPPVLLAGPLLITQAADPDSPYLLAALRTSDGHRAWQTTIPEPPQAPLSATPGGILVYTATIPHYC